MLIMTLDPNVVRAPPLLSAANMTNSDHFILLILTDFLQLTFTRKNEMSFPVKISGPRQLSRHFCYKNCSSSHQTPHHFFPLYDSSPSTSGFEEVNIISVQVETKSPAYCTSAHCEEELKERDRQKERNVIKNENLKRIKSSRSVHEQSEN